MARGMERFSLGFSLALAWEVPGFIREGQSTHRVVEVHGAGWTRCVFGMCVCGGVRSNELSSTSVCGGRGGGGGLAAVVAVGFVRCQCFPQAPSFAVCGPVPIPAPPPCCLWRGMLLSPSRNQVTMHSVPTDFFVKGAKGRLPLLTGFSLSLVICMCCMLC